MTDTPQHALNLGWETAQALGLFAALLGLLLCLLPVRPRRSLSGTIPLATHELLGWLMLAAAVAHVLLCLASDHAVIEHLRLTAPWYEWAGILALLACLVLTLPSTGALRAYLWSRHRNFQALHVGMTCLLVALIAVHVVTTNRLVHGPLRVTLYLVLSAVALLGLLRARRGAPAAPPPRGLAGRLVFGRHSKLILFLTGSAALVTASLFSAHTRLALREPFAARAAAPPLDFPHDKHRDVNCLACHHNFADLSGTQACISCHRSAQAALQVGAEARFHAFCLGCHRDPPANFRHHGPVTGCESCHAPTGGEVRAF